MAKKVRSKLWHVCGWFFTLFFIPIGMYSAWSWVMSRSIFEEGFFNFFITSIAGLF